MFNELAGHMRAALSALCQGEEPDSIVEGFLRRGLSVQQAQNVVGLAARCSEVVLGLDDGLPADQAYARLAEVGLPKPVLVRLVDVARRTLAEVTDANDQHESERAFAKAEQALAAAMPAHSDQGLEQCLALYHKVVREMDAGRSLDQIVVSVSTDAGLPVPMAKEFATNAVTIREAVRQVVDARDPTALASIDLRNRPPYVATMVLHLIRERHADPDRLR